MPSVNQRHSRTPEGRERRGRTVSRLPRLSRQTGEGRSVRNRDWFSRSLGRSSGCCESWGAVPGGRRLSRFWRIKKWLLITESLSFVKASYQGTLWDLDLTVKRQSHWAFSGVCHCLWTIAKWKEAWVIGLMHFDKSFPLTNWWQPFLYKWYPFLRFHERKFCGERHFSSFAHFTGKLKQTRNTKYFC